MYIADHGKVEEKYRTYMNVSDRSGSCSALCNLPLMLLLYSLFQVMRVYNMGEEDFSTTEEWNMYLEEIEEIVYNITNDINRSEMEKKMENYERQHKNDIRKNYAKKCVFKFSANKLIVI